MGRSSQSLKDFVSEMVEEKLKEIMGDPDYGLELRAWVKKRLKKLSSGSKRNRFSARDAARRLGLRWE